ncbi:assimilatory nitrate reductase catalytic subunit [Arthrobacter sp. CAN_A212]|uniref:molybdopterin oxidoreductase family protein n=1 Tax=unclassified Arthrobacter TaxID=235627 RepID=UPI0018CB9363|nr:molybdopterin oxidoreductase family protein [Arthrobacter sp. CAN_C5]MBP2215214.1 assimilatory nitrate reductase catalytic subunit [Arthrobacter sp. CAN_C5]
MEQTDPGQHTHCPYCALQCAMTVSAPTADSGVRVGGRDFPTNRGGLCRKGWSAADLLRHPDRLTAPLLRGTDGVLREAPWDDVLQLINDRVRAIQADHGRDAVAVFGGGGLTNEKAYTLGKFARLALRTSRIDYNGRFCMSSAAAAGNRAFGVDRGLPFPVEDLDAASVVLLLGSNAADTMPPFVQHLRGAQGAGGLIVVDPRRSATARLTDQGKGIHLQPTPGTDLALLLGLAHVVVAEGLEDRAFLEERTIGHDDVARGLARWWPERVQSLTGVPAASIRATARLLARGARSGASGGSGAYILTGRGIEQHADGTDTTTAAINLALLLGLPGTSHSGYGTLTGQGNGQGGREHGQKADQLPGYRKITEPAGRAHVASVWGVPEDAIPGPGLPAVELLAALGRPDGVRCLFVHGANIAVSAPNAATVIAGLRSLDLLVVSDFFLSETAALADVVLPVLQWAEEEGTITNLEGRALRRRAAVAPPEGARSELWIMQELARLLEAPSLFSEDPETMFNELARASAGGLADYSGLDYDLLDGGTAAYWPYPSGGTGTPRLFLNAFAHPGGRAALIRVAPLAATTGSRVPAPLLLATGRLLEHYQSGTQTRRVLELLSAQPEPRLQLHPATADDLGIAQDDRVVITSENGEAHALADLTADIRQDTVFLAFHYAEAGSANRLTGSATDPISGMPEFKTTPVRVAALATHPSQSLADKLEVNA